MADGIIPGTQVNRRGFLGDAALGIVSVASDAVAGPRGGWC